MSKTRVLGVGVLVALVALLPRVAAAQTPAITVTYPAGWNMVGAPTGTDFTALAPLYGWTGTQYILPANNTTTLCTGYWSREITSTTVTLAGPSAGPTQNCPLQSGWNLVGNPFTGAAILPIDTLAYTTTLGTTVYAQIHTIPQGSAAWVYTESASTLMLTYQQTNVPPPATIVITDPALSGPYTMHVGDRIELLNNAALPVTATEDGRYLHLLSAGLTGGATCGTQGQCNFNLANQFWLWQATAAGETSIRIDAVCKPGQENCAHTQSIQVNILPNS